MLVISGSQTVERVITGHHAESATQAVAEVNTGIRFFYSEEHAYTYLIISSYLYLKYGLCNE